MKSTGKLVYSPRSHLGDPKKWLVLMCDDEISKYYRHIFYRETPWKGKLNRPIWGAHVSIIRDERISMPSVQWGWKNNHIVEFEYDAGVRDNEIYYWLNVRCPQLSEVRNHYGLSDYPKYGFHLTIGRKAEF